MLDDWRADGYRWRQGGSCARTKITKKYFKIYTGPGQWSKEFTRVAHFHPEHPKAVLIQYLGNEAVAMDFAHGNSSKATKNYVRTQPAILKKIKESSGSGTARKVYQTLIEEGNPSSSTSVPRDQEQVRNALKASRRKFRLSRDALYNLHEIAYDTDFVRHITSHPDLTLVMWMDETIQVFRDTLRKTNCVQRLSYDTTFCLGDFYVSVLLFSETEFMNEPVIPLAFMIHERKTTKTHDIFWQHIKSVCPELNTSKQVIIVTDQEKSIIDAIQRSFPNLQHFLCWNHVIQDCKRWLKSHGVQSADEMRYYTDNVRSLLESKTEDEYKEKFISLIPRWSLPFTEYFSKIFHPLMNKLGSWVLAEFGLSQISANQSESFNAVLKRIQEWKEAPVDAMVLSLFRLTQFYITEIFRGRRLMGDFCLKIELLPLYRDDLTAIPTAISPDDIVHRIRENLLQQGAAFETATTENDRLPSATVAERAQFVIDQDYLTLNSKLGVFTIKGSNDPRVVSLFPKETCSCPAVGNCYHIVAAKQAIGLSVVEHKKPINLTQLRKAARKRPEKTAGRKRPRPADVDPAGDTSAQDVARIEAIIKNTNFKKRKIDVLRENDDESMDANVVGEVNVNCDDENVTCSECGLEEVAKEKCINGQLMNWVGCNVCERWLHLYPFFAVFLFSFISFFSLC